MSGAKAVAGKRVFIIGAGLAALAAGVALARRGMRVRVFEKTARCAL